MQTRAAFHLWPRLHQDLLGFLALVPGGDVTAKPRGFAQTIGASFRHVAEVEAFWRRAILEPDAPYRPLDPEATADLESIRAALTAAFAGIERLLDASLLDAMYERPVKTGFPVKNALEALTLCHLHTVHHRAILVIQLRALGAAPEDWI